MRRTYLLIMLLTLTVGGVRAAVRADDGVRKKWNLVVILADDLGWSERTWGSGQAWPPLTRISSQDFVISCKRGRLPSTRSIPLRTQSGTDENEPPAMG